LPNSGHLRITVGPDGVKTEYVRVYKASSETANRHNKDVSATYFIGAKNCYDSLSTGIPVIWNSLYDDELVYPNPFERETKIEFSLQAIDQIHAKIYREDGTLVRQLMDGNTLDPGKYQIVWDGLDGLKRSMSSGVYYYEIRGTVSGIKTGKIIKAQ
jgi:hypothetical protein